MHPFGGSRAFVIDVTPSYGIGKHILRNQPRHGHGVTSPVYGEMYKYMIVKTKIGSQDITSFHL